MADLGRMALQAQGKVRRLVLANVKRRKVESCVSQRRGACKRCGDCCKILFRCPFLAADDAGKHACRIYSKRFPSCRFFPIQVEDLEEVSRCGFTFARDSELPAV